MDEAAFAPKGVDGVLWFMDEIFTDGGDTTFENSQQVAPTVVLTLDNGVAEPGAPEDAKSDSQAEANGSTVEIEDAFTFSEELDGTAPLEGEVLDAPAAASGYLPAHLQLLALLDRNAPHQTTAPKIRLRNQLGQVEAASASPEVQGRRAFQMSLWSHGYTEVEITRRVNEWLTEHGMTPVSRATIHNDKLAIYADWEDDYDASSPENRAQHIANFNFIKSLALEAFEEHRHDKGKGAGVGASYLRIAAQMESELAAVDGTKTRAKIQAESESQGSNQDRITRVYMGVNLAALEEQQRRGITVQAQEDE